MYDGPDNSYEPREYDEDKSDDIHARIVAGAIYALALLIAFYFWLSRYGRLIGVLGSLVLTLAAFAAYQWIRVWLNVRRQERGPADDGSPIMLNLKASDSNRSDDEGE